MVRKRRYWYEFYHEECVICGTGDTYKERRYGRKPKNYYRRHHFQQTACSSHFI